jgi:uncharacterized phage protein (TIGR02216 family)
MKKFAWPIFMRAGLSQLRLKPDEFWALTPAELMVMLGVGPSTVPMGRSRLDDLVAAFPDETPAKTGAAAGPVRATERPAVAKGAPETVPAKGIETDMS